MAQTKEYRKQYYANNKARMMEKAKKWNTGNPERRARIRRDSRYRKDFGITSVQYEVMLESQNRRCKICLRHEDTFKNYLAVDHCHKTGKVRGLLCFNCNTALGSMQDDLAAIRAMAAYLETS